MKHDSFEDKLRKAPFRELPADWRFDVLASAREAGANQAPVRPQRWAWAALWRWLYPSPRAWYALAGCWLLIGALHVSTMRLAPSPASSPRADAAVLARLIHQQREAMLLLDSFSTQDRDPGNRQPRPRSQNLNPIKLA